MRNSFRRLRAAVTGLVVLLVFGGCSFLPGEPVLEGIVETSVYGHYTEVAGKILELPVELGQEVKAGDVLAVLDDRHERYALAQFEETLAKKQAVLAELQEGVDPEELKQAQNNVSLAELAYAGAQLTRDQLRKNYEEAQALLEAGAMVETEVDQLKYKLDLAENGVETAALQLENARQQLELLQKGISQAKIDAARAEVALTQVQISQIKDNLSRYTVTALCDGTVISKNYLPGNVVAAGYNLVDIASETEKHLVTYIPENLLSGITYGQELVIRKGGREYTGTVGFIDVKAQYTPRDMQTSANKNKESMKVKINLPSDIPLKIGEKAEVLITR